MFVKFKMCDIDSINVAQDTVFWGLRPYSRPGAGKGGPHGRSVGRLTARRGLVILEDMLSTFWRDTLVTGLALQERAPEP